jgi:hypothetical protein
MSMSFSVEVQLYLLENGAIILSRSQSVPASNVHSSTDRDALGTWPIGTQLGSRFRRRNAVGFRRRNARRLRRRSRRFRRRHVGGLRRRHVGRLRRRNVGRSDEGILDGSDERILVDGSDEKTRTSSICVSYFRCRKVYNIKSPGRPARVMHGCSEV